MPKQLKSREVFVKTMDRVDGLLALHSALHGKTGRPKQQVSDLLRGSLVLAVSALDGLVLEAVLEAIRPAAKANRLGPNLAKWVRAQPEVLLTAFSRTDPVQAVIELATEKLGHVTFQKAAMIEETLRDTAGVEPPWELAAVSLSGVSSSWNAIRVRNELDDFVDRRHRIAHAGDRTPGAKAATPITRAYVERASRVVRAVGLAVCEQVEHSS